MIGIRGGIVRIRSMLLLGGILLAVPLLAAALLSSVALAQEVGPMVLSDHQIINRSEDDVYVFHILHLRNPEENAVHDLILPLARGADSLQPVDGFTAEELTSLEVTEEGLSGFALEAGEERRFSYSYRLPDGFESGYRRSVLYPTGELAVFVPEDRIRLADPGGILTSEGIEILAEQSFRRYGAVALAAGTVLLFPLKSVRPNLWQRVSTALSEQKAEPVSPGPAALAAALLLGIFAFFVLRWGRIRRFVEAVTGKPQRKTGAEESLKGTGDARRSTDDRESERLIEAIARLDLRFERGTIDKAEYGRRRSELKKRLQTAEAEQPQMGRKGEESVDGRSE